MLHIDRYMYHLDCIKIIGWLEHVVTSGIWLSTEKVHFFHLKVGFYGNIFCYMSRLGEFDSLICSL